jgi:hypothetical protein
MFLIVSGYGLVHNTIFNNILVIYNGGQSVSWMRKPSTYYQPLTNFMITQSCINLIYC